MRAIVPLLTLATAVMLGGCAVTVYRLGPAAESLSADGISGGGSLDNGSLLQITAAQQELSLRAAGVHDANAFTDPWLSSPALLAPSPVELDPRLQDPTLLNPLHDPRQGLPGPGMPGL